MRGNSGSSSPQAQAPAPAQQSGPATYTTNASGQPVYNNGGVQITYPQGYTAGAPAAPVRNLTEARELMTGRYQAFLAAGSNPTLQATAYQNYMQSKQQYETLAAQARAAASPPPASTHSGSAPGAGTRCPPARTGTRSPRPAP